MLLPEQMAVTPEMVTVGVSLMVMLWLAVAVHPLEVPVTVYGPDVVGLMASPVAPLLQE